MPNENTSTDSDRTVSVPRELEWEPGSLSTRTIERIATDALADLWRDCYRRDGGGSDIFYEKLAAILSAATGKHHNPSK